ncbi:MAG: DUF1127 domain-containing protein [Rhodobacteraceae bacterium]|nr:DUF1127 domain-containing protein [Paracoccaceae bacterium]
MAFAHDVQYLEHSLADRLHLLRAAFVEWNARRAVFRQVTDELSVLSDRDLADLGFSRLDIPRVAREAAAAV